MQKDQWEDGRDSSKWCGFSCFQFLKDILHTSRLRLMASGRWGRKRVVEREGRIW